MKLKLYVWTNVLWNWRPGTMFALASSEEEARELIKGDGFAEDEDFINGDLAIYDEPCGFTIPGGD